MSVLWEKPEGDTESSPSLSSSSDRDGKEPISATPPQLAALLLVESLSSSSDAIGDSFEGGTNEPVSTLEESWGSRIRIEKPDSMLSVNQQELIKQYHLKKHIDNLESDVQKKEEVVNRLRYA